MPPLNAAMINDSHHITRLNKTNIADLEHLYFVVYGKRRPGYFEKKYATPYTHMQYMGFIAYNQEAMPVAFYAVIPCFLYCNGETILSAQSIDAMTHPLYRNKGLFVELGQQTHQLCRDNGINLLFGFPNQHSLPALIHELGFQQTTTMDFFMIPVSTWPLEKITLRFPLLKKAYLAYSRWVLRKYISPQAGIASSVIADGFNGIWRNDAYLSWKRYHDTIVVTIQQASIWIRLHNGMMIGDMRGVHANNFRIILRQLIKLAQQMGVAQLQFHSSRGTSLHALFSRQYQAHPSFPVIFKPLHNETDLASIRFTFADIDIF